MPNVQAVVFDIGNVLIEWQPERFFDSVIGAERRREMFATIDLHGMNDRVDRGETFHEVIVETAARYPEWHDEVMIWHDRWIEMAAPAIPHSVRLLRALRAQGVPVFALTNFGIQTFEIAEPVYPVSRAGITGLVKHLKEGGVIGIVIDVFSRKGEPLTFFG